MLYCSGDALNFLCKLTCGLIFFPSHTYPGSLKICIYEGVRSTSLSKASAVDISKLISADIVLTTYDVLKEDLSHDSDRHEGDRRFMRFQKRFLLSFCFILKMILIFD